MLRQDVLRDKRDFDRLFKSGRSNGGKYVVIFYIKNNLGFNRRAFMASKKVGNSVMRNRARRLMKESWRNTESRVKRGFDILFIARNTIAGTKCQEVEKSMVAVLKKSNLFQ